MGKPSFAHYAAIDPLALILREDIYVRLHLPDPSPEVVKEVAESVKMLSDEEKRFVANRVASFASFFNTLAKEIGAKTGE